LASERGSDLPYGVSAELGAADLEQAEAGDVVVQPVGGLDPQLGERGYECGRRDAFTRDQRERLVRTWRGRHHHRPAGVQRAEDAGAAEREVVAGR
jgi:hypothetical protein